MKICAEALIGISFCVLFFPSGPDGTFPLILRSWTKMKRQTRFDKILILDFGSQHTQLIARRIRECQIYSEIHRYNMPLERIRDLSPKGIILSGGPASVYDDPAPHCDPGLFKMGIPILGICYGMQLISHSLGGEVAYSQKREYGKAKLILDQIGNLFKGSAERL
jgi:GMP synthase (glutamine-hydrolysing)